MDMVIINPTLDYKSNAKENINRRIDENISVNESPLIGVGYLLSSLRSKNFEVEYLDMVVNEMDVDGLLKFLDYHKPKLVGFSTLTVNIKASDYLAKIIKIHFPDQLICLGGPHINILKIQTLEEFESFDFGVLGEGEKVLPLILEKNGIEEIFKVSGVITKDSKDISYEIIQDIEAIPFPDWSGFDLDKYPGNCPHRTYRELPVLASRGCPYKCIFCCHALGRKVRKRSADSVILEIKRNIDEYGCTAIVFLDETFACNLKWTNEFLDKMIEEGINKEIIWSCSTRVNNTSKELFKKMKTAGCYHVFFGLESGNEATLERIKKQATLDQARQSVKWAKEAGIIPVGSFIIGLPGDTEKEIKESIEFAKELDMYSTTFPIATPFPGTELRRMALDGEYGMRILTSDWDFYSKQNCRALESDNFLWKDMFKMQKYAYEQISKQNIDNYLKKISCR